MDNTVQDTVGNRRVADLLMPMLDGNLGCQDQRSALITVIADFQKIAPFGVFQCRQILFFLSFATPIASSLGALEWVAILYEWLSTTMGGDRPGPEILGAVLHYWSVFLIGVSTPITILSVMALARRLQLRSYMPVVFGIPFYWIFVGCCATAALFRGTRDWGKTDR